MHAKEWSGTARWWVTTEMSLINHAHSQMGRGQTMAKGMPAWACLHCFQLQELSCEQLATRIPSLVSEHTAQLSVSGGEGPEGSSS